MRIFMIIFVLSFLVVSCDESDEGCLTKKYSVPISKISKTTETDLFKYTFEEVYLLTEGKWSYDNFIIEIKRDPTKEITSEYAEDETTCSTYTILPAVIKITNENNESEEKSIFLTIRTDYGIFTHSPSDLISGFEIVFDKNHQNINEITITNTNQTYSIIKQE